MTFRAIVFDLDDTLYPERAYTISGFRAVGRWASSVLEVASSDCSNELIALHGAGHTRDTFDRWLALRGTTDQSLVRQMVTVFRDHSPDIALEQPVAALLKRLRRRYVLGLVSDGYLEVQRKKVAALALDRFLDSIVLSDEIGRDAWKPSPRPFVRVLEGLAADAREAVYVADNPAKDFAGARAVGMASVRLRSKDGVYGRLEPSSPHGAPDVEITDIGDVERAIKRLAAERTATKG
jgi:putative hydrolase of the HAD superfamily